MLDSKLIMLMAMQLELARIDNALRRGIAAQVLVELGCIPDHAIPVDPGLAYHKAMEWVDYSYERGERPDWFDEDWLSDEW